MKLTGMPIFQIKTLSTISGYALSILPNFGKKSIYRFSEETAKWLNWVTFD